MVCGVCKKNFTRSSDVADYYNKKRAFEDQMSKMIDTMTEEELNIKNQEIWNELLQFEALLLGPESKPKKCSNENCSNHICRNCYNGKSCKICSECTYTTVKND